MSLRNIQVIRDLPFSVKPFVDITDTLPSRTPDPEPMRTLEQITHASLHHSAVEGGTIQGYADYHVNKLGWAHIGYHNVIKLDTLYQTNNWLTKSYHTSSHNGYTISFSISGDLSKRALTDIERKLLYAGLLTALSVFPKLRIENIRGHNEYPDNATSCPCIDMNQVRADVKNLQMLMDQQNTWEAKIAKVSDMINQFNYMNKLLTPGPSDGNAQWAMNQQLDLYDLMKQQGLLK